MCPEYKDRPFSFKNVGKLIFVFRETGEKLHKHLALKFPVLRPKLIFGKGGWLGMGWDTEGGQQEAIDEFNSGRCNLLVSTSVLEEGLDIETCEMVIIFSGTLSLIRLVQLMQPYPLRTGRLVAAKKSLVEK